MSYSVVSSRNEKVWDDYLSELALNPSLSLARFLRTRHVGVHSYENWMSRKGYSAREAKARAASLQPEPLRRESMAPEESFVSVSAYGYAYRKWEDDGRMATGILPCLSPLCIGV